MKKHSSVLRDASACIEALEVRSLMSGEIDHTFGVGGAAAVGSGEFTAVQADGKIIVAGASATKGTTAVVTRYLANGQVDTDFGTNGSVSVANVHADRLNGVAVTASGAILLEGQTYVRLTSAGTLDTTFGGGDGMADSLLAGDRRQAGPNGNAVLPDGSFYEVSNFANGQPRLYKYKADGSLDTTFANKGSYALATLPSFKNTYTVVPGSQENGGPGVLSEVGGIVADAQGRVYVTYADRFTNDALGTVGLTRIVRFTAAGKIDTTWGNQGFYAGTGDTTSGGNGLGSGSIALLPNGNLVLEQDSPGDNFAFPGIIEVNPSGHVVAATGVDEVRQIVAAKDGSVYVVQTLYDDGGDPYNGPLGFSYASVLHLKSDLSVDTNYSVDHDGVAGFRTHDDYASAKNGVVTPQGDFVLLGSVSPTSSDLVKFDGPTKATRVTYSRTGDKLVVNGSSGDDYMLATNDDDDLYGSYALEIRFDDNNQGLVSQDKLIVDNTDDDQPAIKNLVFNLNSGNDVFDGSKLAQKVYVSGGNGNDTITIGAPYTAHNATYSTVYGGAGNDNITVYADYATVHGDTGNDVVYALQHSHVYGDDDNDNVYAGDYSLLSGGNGTDGLGHINAKNPATLDGGAGTDFGSYIAGDTLIGIEYPHQQ